MDMARIGAAAGVLGDLLRKVGATSARVRVCADINNDSETLISINVVLSETTFCGQSLSANCPDVFGSSELVLNFRKKSEEKTNDEEGVTRGDEKKQTGRARVCEELEEERAISISLKSCTGVGKEVAKVGEILGGKVSSTDERGQSLRSDEGGKASSTDERGQSLRSDQAEATNPQPREFDENLLTQEVTNPKPREFDENLQTKEPKNHRTKDPTNESRAGGEALGARVEMDAAIVEGARRRIAASPCEVLDNPRTHEPNNQITQDPTRGERKAARREATRRAEIDAARIVARLEQRRMYGLTGGFLETPTTSPTTTPNKETGEPKNLQTQEPKNQETPKPKSRWVDAAAFVRFFNETMQSSGRSYHIRTVSGARLGVLRARVKEFGKEDLCRAVRIMASNDFLMGANKWGRPLGVDWLLKQQNLSKVLEGQYDNKKSPAASSIGTATGVALSHAVSEQAMQATSTHIEKALRARQERKQVEQQQATLRISHKEYLELKARAARGDPEAIARLKPPDGS